jgi:hypothetical protein
MKPENERNKNVAWEIQQDLRKHKKYPKYVLGFRNHQKRLFTCNCTKENQCMKPKNILEMQLSYLIEN